MLKKVICLFLLVMIIFACIFSLPAYANNAEGSGGGGGGNANFSTSGFTENTSFNKSVSGVMGNFVKIIRAVVVGIATIMLLAVAMKYMIAAPGERAEIKGTAVKYLIGAVLLYGTGGVLTIISNFAEKNITLTS